MDYTFIAITLDGSTYCDLVCEPNKSVWKFFEFDKNTWNYIAVSKQMVITKWT